MYKVYKLCIKLANQDWQNYSVVFWLEIAPESLQKMTTSAEKVQKHEKHSKAKIDVWMACQKVHKQVKVKVNIQSLILIPSLHLSQESEDVGMGLCIFAFTVYPPFLPCLCTFCMPSLHLFSEFSFLYTSFPHYRQYNQSINDNLTSIARSGINSNCQQQWLYLGVRASYCAFSWYSYNSFSCVVPCFTCFHYSFETTLRWHATLSFQGQQTWNPSW